MTNISRRFLSNDKIIDKIKQSVLDHNVDNAIELTKNALARGTTPITSESMVQTTNR